MTPWHFTGSILFQFVELIPIEMTTNCPLCARFARTLICAFYFLLVLLIQSKMDYDPRVLKNRTIEADTTTESIKPSAPFTRIVIAAIYQYSCLQRSNISVSKNAISCRHLSSLVVMGIRTRTRWPSNAAFVISLSARDRGQMSITIINPSSVPFRRECENNNPCPTIKTQ